MIHLIKQFMEFVPDAMERWGYYAVFVATFLETSAFIGLMVPGETAVVVAGFFAAQGSMGNDAPFPFQLLKVMGFAAAGAFCGDTTGYCVGRYLGEKIILKWGKFFFVRERELEKVRYYINKHGGKTIFFGRFTSFLRAFAPFVAGMTKMPVRKFLAYDATGAIPWAVAFSLLGFICRESWERAQKQVGHAILIALILVVVIIIFYHKRRKKNV